MVGVRPPQNGGQQVKALTLHQPWASLVALGHKRVETRSWSTNYRGGLAIHASKSTRPLRTFAAQQLCRPMTDDEYVSMPFGAVVAVCRLSYVVPMERVAWPSLLEMGYGDLPMLGWDVAIPEHDGEDTVLVRPDQEQLGDFGPGRYAWLLDEIRPLARPEEARGALGLWEWQPADPTP